MENKNEIPTLSLDELNKILSMSEKKKEELTDELRLLNLNSKTNFKNNVLLTSYATMWSTIVDYLAFLQTLVLFWGATSAKFYIDTNKEVKVEKELRKNEYLYNLYKQELNSITSSKNVKRLQIK